MKKEKNREELLTAEDGTTRERTVSFRIPRISMPGAQSLFLILLIVVGLLQTVQLFGLQGNIASAKVNAGGGSSPTAAAPAQSGSSALPQMVGGC